MELHEKIDLIETREDLSNFVRDLKDDLVKNEDKDEWENPTLERFLEAMGAWIYAMDGYYKNLGEEMPEHPTWKVFARILLSSKYYE